MLWYLHLCAIHNIIALEYIDGVIGFMKEFENGSGKFVEVTLNPKIIISHSININKANLLHEEANKMCFIANSCNLPIKHNQTIRS